MFRAAAKKGIFRIGERRRRVVMIWLRWRERLVFLAMSLVVAWHSFAIIVAPTPAGSTIVQTSRALVQPYLSLFRLDNQWNFFVPVTKYTQFRYLVEDAAGKQHLFIPVEEPSESVSRYVMWREFKYFFEGVMEAPQLRAPRIGALLCQKHASLKPVAISFLQVQELDFWPENYLQGGRPLDPEFISVGTLANVRC
jgi:hypothetical protein